MAVGVEKEDKVYLWVSPTKGMIRFHKSGKLSPMSIGPYEILETVGNLAYKLALPHSQSRVHNVFHVSQLRRYLHDAQHMLED